MLAVLSLLSVFVEKAPAQSGSEDPSIDETINQSLQNLHQWGAINSFHGLPSQRVNDIEQTPDGMLWFATNNGLAKFDGRRVQTEISSTLGAVRILALKVDKKGSLWVGTDTGAYLRVGNSFRQINGTNDIAIRSIYLDPESGKIYLVGEGGKIFEAEADEASVVTTTKILDDDIPVTSINKVKNNLYVGSFNRGLLQLNEGKSQAVLTNPRPFFINVLANSPSGEMWVGARSSRGNSGLFSSEKLPALNIVGSNLGTVNDIGFSGGNVWVATEDRGAYLFEGKEFRKRFTFENTTGGLRSNRILSVFVDREGIVWFGTDKGVNRFDPKGPRNERVSADIQSNFVRTFYKTKKGMVLAGTNRGLFKFDETSKTWTIFRDLSSQTVYSIFEEGSEDLYVGTRSGLFVLEAGASDGSGADIAEDEDIRSIKQFKGSTYIASLGDGLERLEGEEQRLAFKTDVISLHNDEDKRLWVGTIRSGVFVYDGSKELQPVELEQLKNNAIRSIAGNSKDGIWFGTDQGLFLYKDGKLELVLAEQNVRDVKLEKLGENRVGVWCAAETGLYRLTFSGFFGWISSRIDVEQGLASQNVFALLPTDQMILIGTNRGIVRYTKNEMPPLLMPTRIVSQRVHSVSELTSGIELPYPQNNLSVEVAAISSHTFSEQIQYGFLLFSEGGTFLDFKFSKDAQYLMDNLTPGDYRVEVYAYDRDLNSSEPLSFTFSVGSAPFPWIATVLAILLAITFAALIWAVFSQRKIFRTSKQLVDTNKELNSARLDLANEAERERHRISRDLHDQTLADLRHLLLMTDEVPTEKAPGFRKEIENISDEIRRICEDLSPSVLENIGFSAALEWALRSALDQVNSDKSVTSEFDCEVDVEDKTHLSGAEQIQIYRVTQEVLSNIVRHSDAGSIKLSAFSRNDRFILEIHDDSSGFDPESSEKGRGLSNIKARAKLIEADVEWKAKDGSGMLFRLVK